MARFSIDDARNWGLSISDDDLCATCKHLDYQPGEESRCRKGFPAEFNQDGYAVSCDLYWTGEQTL